MARMKELMMMVEETRETLRRNGSVEMAETLSLESVLQGVNDMHEMGCTNWTVEMELHDLVMESWGEDC